MTWIVWKNLSCFSSAFNFLDILSTKLNQTFFFSYFYLSPPSVILAPFCQSSSLHVDNMAAFAWEKWPICHLILRAVATAIIITTISVAKTTARLPELSTNNTSACAHCQPRQSQLWIWTLSDVSTAKLLKWLDTYGALVIFCWNCTRLKLKKTALL